ncbi:hypothetical protein [Thioalkalivibrio sp. XN279]|uniref:hypothetical protein n=1 Tax=Thioalkalivibrio sp. XN279 TaxID=2714953 RepID=UPI00140BF4EB|nr:hypothetical protein [Thioalkalivibrio sp. XN279]NHA13938.1 hypothetical protein [Thioalkalivibrio sp. XN279]
MAEQEQRDPRTHTAESSEELARLRDRTDELELIISSLTTFALFTLPGWLFERFADAYMHLSVTLVVSSSTALLLLTGLCYGLGACFLLHLLARAYWVGLIGLRAVFPQGIDWNRTPGIGPLTRENYRRRLPDLQSAIERSDRLASSLFAVISVIALAIVWIVLLITLAASLGGLVGSRFGATNFGINAAALGLVAVAAGSAVLLWILDALLAQRVPALQRAAWFRGLVSVLSRINGWLVPQRLVLPVQLTLQSNTRPIIAMILFVVAVIAIVVLGQFSFNRAVNFTVSDQFRYLDDQQEQHFAGAVFRSSFYEDMRHGKDRLRARPMIPSFEQRGSHLRLFLPYQPIRDNLLLERLCPGEEEGLGAPCLARLWSVALNGQPVDLGRFLASERLDLGMRGLTGVVPLDGLAPGLQVLSVTWNPHAGSDDVPIDDRYTEARLDFDIPFLFAPEFERALPDPRGSPAGDIPDSDPLPEES